jgi:predicted phage terminase large subunit-like protein
MNGPFVIRSARAKTMPELLDPVMRMLLYAEAQKKLKRKKDALGRIRHLCDNPQDLCDDDIEMFQQCDGRTLRALFEKQPEFRQRQREYNESPQQILASLAGFTRRAWRYIRDPNPFSGNFHIDLLGQEYEDLFYGRNDRLIVNQPPGTMKTFLLEVFFPAWVWAKDPTRRFGIFSYADEPMQPPKEAFLNLITSDWYQKNFGRIKIVRDNEKEGIVNNRGGTRYMGKVGGPLTGLHPHFLLIDDPHKALDVYSSKLMKKALRWFASTVASRGMLQKMAIVVCMQRLAVNDLCGILLGEMLSGAIDMPDALKAELIGSEWQHACLPMRFDPDHRYRWEKDPRTKKGQLLWESMMTEAMVRNRIKMMELDKEQANVPAQFDQDPMSKAGTLFENVRGALIKAEDLPKKLVHGMAIRGWDRADSDEAADLDPTAGVLMIEYEGIKYIVNRVKFQKTAVDRDNTITKVSGYDKNQWDNYRVANEVNPGPDGKFAHNYLAAKLSPFGIICMAQKVTKDKRQRATQFAAGIKYGEVRILDGQDWTKDFVDELERFPNAPHDDQVDAGAHAYNGIEDWKLGKV